MNSNATRCLQRGAFLGLALLLFAQSAAGEQSDFLRDTLRRELRGQSYILIENDGVHQVLILGQGEEPSRVMRIEPDDRKESLYELADSNDAYATSALVAALSDPSDDVRYTAVRLLGEMESAEARMALESLLADPDIELRLEVVEAVVDTPGSDELLWLASLNNVELVADAARGYLAEREYPD